MKNNQYYDMPDLERAFETDMYQTAADAAEQGLERELERLYNEPGTDDEFETEVPEYESDDPEYEFDDSDDSGDGEFEFELESSYFPPSPYAERLYELTQREFENEYELHASMNELVEDMHREFFFGFLGRRIKGGLKTVTRWAKKGIRAVNKNPVLKSLIEKGIKHVADAYAPGTGGIAVAGLNMALEPLNEGMTQRAEGLLQKGMDAVQGKATAAATDLMKKFGIDPAKGTDAVKGGLQNLVDSLKKSFEFAAENLHEDIDDPIAAERLATRAFEVGIARGISAGHKGGKYIGQNTNQPGTRVIRLQEKPGEEIEKIVIVIREKSGK